MRVRGLRDRGPDPDARRVLRQRAVVARVARPAEAEPRAQALRADARVAPERAADGVLVGAGRAVRDVADQVRERDLGRAEAVRRELADLAARGRHAADADRVPRRAVRGRGHLCQVSRAEKNASPKY